MNRHFEVISLSPNRNAIEDGYKWKLEGKWNLEGLKTIYETGRDIELYADSVTGGNGLDWMQQDAFGSTTIAHWNGDHADAMPYWTR